MAAPPPASSAVERDWVDAVARAAAGDLASAGVDVRRLRRLGFAKAARSGPPPGHTRHYSTTLRFGASEDQGQSGYCWLFAPEVLVRTAAIKAGSLAETASFSETYLYFFSLLEKASACLDDLRHLAAQQRRLASDTLQRGLSSEVMGLGDGGEWEWAFNLIEKYGLVPATAMRQTASARDTAALRAELHERLAIAARALRRPGADYAVIRTRAMHDVVRMLVAHLGVPPADVAVPRRGRLSPRRYAHDVIGFRPREWRIVISNPALPYGTVYWRRDSAIISGETTFNLRRLNVPQSRMQALVRDSLAHGHAVGFSADFTRNDIDHTTGIMHPDVFDRRLIYGRVMTGEISRADEMYLGVAASNHAMAITGIDEQPQGARGGRRRTVKYQVANSWGEGVGDHGTYHMYAEWFEQNVFKLAVHKSVLNGLERAAYDHPVRAPGGQLY